MKLKDVKKSKINNKTYALFKMERRQNYKSLITFSLITVALIVLTICMSPLFKSVTERLIEMMGEAFSDMFSQLLGSSDFNSYFVLQVGEWWGLLAIIFGSYLGYTLVASNFKNRSHIMLYSLNLSRWEILRAKVMRLLINVIIFNLLCALASVVTILLFGFEFAYLNLAIYALFMTLVTLISGMITFSLTLFAPHKMNAILSTLLPVLLYFFASLAMLDNKISFFAYFSPISIIMDGSANHILANGFYGLNYYILALWAGIAIILMPIAMWQFNKKDLV